MYEFWLPFGIFKLFFYQRPHLVTLPNHWNALSLLPLPIFDLCNGSTLISQSLVLHTLPSPFNHLIFTNGSTLLFSPVIWIVSTNLPCFPIQLLDLYVLSDPTGNSMNSWCDMILQLLSKFIKELLNPLCFRMNAQQISVNLSIYWTSGIMRIYV
jgi:hypothetical protein